MFFSKRTRPRLKSFLALHLFLIVYLAMLLALAALVTIFCGLVSVLLLYNHWQAAKADRCPQANERKVLLWLEERGLRLPDPEEILTLLQPSIKKLQPLEEGIVSCFLERNTYAWPYGYHVRKSEIDRWRVRIEHTRLRCAVLSQPPCPRELCVVIVNYILLTLLGKGVAHSHCLEIDLGTVVVHILYNGNPYVTNHTHSHTRPPLA